MTKLTPGHEKILKALKKLNKFATVREIADEAGLKIVYVYHSMMFSRALHPFIENKGTVLWGLSSRKKGGVL